MSGRFLMGKPSVSVVIPTNNRPALLKEAVRSVMVQTFSASEIIIIDNSSKARGQEQIKDLRRLSNRISAYRFPSNRGVSAARNFGLEKAKGDYILFLDDDDLLHPQMLESSLALFEQNPGVDVVTCLSKAFIDHNSSGRSQKFHCAEQDLESVGGTYPLNHPDYLKLESIAFSALMHYTLVINSCLVKKDCIRTVRFPEDLTAGEDTYFWLRLASQGCRFMLNRRFLSYVRFHAGNSRLSADHDNASIEFFNKLLSSDMLTSRHDFFLVHAHLFLKLLKMRRLGMIRHLLLTGRSPDLVFKYLRSYHSKEAKKMRHLYRFLEESSNTISADHRESPKLSDFGCKDS